MDELCEELAMAERREEKKDGALRKTKEDLESSREENSECAREDRDYKRIKLETTKFTG